MRSSQIFKDNSIGLAIIYDLFQQQSSFSDILVHTHDTHTPSPQCWTYTYFSYTHVDMISPFGVFRIVIPLQSRHKVKCYTSWSAKVLYVILEKPICKNCAPQHLAPYGRFSGNYKKQLQHLNKCHRHLCTIWELCPALPTEIVAICRSRGQYGTH